MTPRDLISQGVLGLVALRITEIKKIFGKVKNLYGMRGYKDPRARGLSLRFRGVINGNNG